MEPGITGACLEQQIACAHTSQSSLGRCGTDLASSSTSLKQPQYSLEFSHLAYPQSYVWDAFDCWRAHTSMVAIPWRRSTVNSIHPLVSTKPQAMHHRLLIRGSRFGLPVHRLPVRGVKHQMCKLQLLHFCKNVIECFCPRTYHTCNSRGRAAAGTTASRSATSQAAFAKVPLPKVLLLLIAAATVPWSSATSFSVLLLMRYGPVWPNDTQRWESRDSLAIDWQRNDQAWASSCCMSRFFRPSTAE